jgi:competence ComEA-like helix-hairpin-helix protein
MLPRPSSRPVGPRRSDALRPLLPASVQPVVAILTAAGLAAMAAWFLLAGGFRGGLVSYDTPPQSTTGFMVDINTAPAIELAQLPRVGPALADRIIERRQTVGPFTSIEQLLDVPGIGEVTLAELRPYLLPIRPPDTPKPGSP